MQKFFSPGIFDNAQRALGCTTRQFIEEQFGNERDRADSELRNEIRSYAVESLMWKHRIAYAHQVHWNEVIFVTKEWLHGDADSMITTDKNIALTIVIADCLPIIMIDEKNAVFAAVHAGRKGCELWIISRTIEGMIKAGAEWGEIKVRIWPWICGKHYPVDVASAQHFSDDYKLPKSDHEFYLDLKKFAVHECLENKISEKNIECSDICTFENERCYSHRLWNVPGGRMYCVVGYRE